MDNGSRILTERLSNALGVGAIGILCKREKGQ